MPFLKPLRAPRLPRPRLCARRAATSAAQSARPTSGPSSSSTSPRKTPSGRLPPSPLLYRSAQPTPPDVEQKASQPLNLAEVPLGSWRSQVLQQGRQAGVDERRVTALWTDCWGRMMADVPVQCSLTGVRLPRSLGIQFRPARFQSDDPNETQAGFVLVPEGVLHPDWSAAVREDDGLAPEPPMTVMCNDIALGHLLGTKKSLPYGSQRQRLDSLPHSNLSAAGAPPAPPSRLSAGVTVVSSSVLAQVEHQLQERVLQEAFILAERVRAARGQGGRLVRAVEEAELAQIRADGRTAGGAATSERTVAFLDTRFEQADMASFFVGGKRSNEVILPAGYEHSKGKGQPLEALDGLPTFASCPTVLDDVPFYALQALMPAAKVDLLAPLLDIIAPETVGAQTRALVTSPSLLGEHGLDPFPLFRALHRLSLFLPHTLAWAPAQRIKCWHLVVRLHDEDVMIATKAQDKAAALEPPLMKDGERIDVRALLAKTTLSAHF